MSTKDCTSIKADWNSRGYSFGVFRDPPEQVWPDFVHRTDELVVLAEGEIEVEMAGKVPRPQIGEEVFIPANAVHTVMDIGRTTQVWDAVVISQTTGKVMAHFRNTQMILY